MKKIKGLSVLFVLLSALSFTSCDTEPVDPVLGENLGQEPNTPGAALFKVDFSGDTHTAVTASAKFEQGALTLVGVMSSAGEFVSITLDDYNEKTYSDAFIGYYPGGSSVSGYLNLNPANGNNNGSVVITDLDLTNNTISGTFSFTGYYVDGTLNLPSIAFTNGTFENIPVTGLPQNPGTPGTNTEYFKAKVNGTAKTFNTVMAVEQMGIIQISGMNIASQENIQIIVPAGVTPGTYTLETFTDYHAAYLSMGGSGAFSDSGTLKIISTSGGWIKGEFNFQGVDMDDVNISVTEGEFSINMN